jgi:hypothetical membrane protein
MSNASKLSGAFISLAYIPAGLLGIFIAERLPLEIRIPFYVLLSVAVIYYRWAGAAKLGRKFSSHSK